MAGGCTKNFESYNTNPFGASEEDLEKDGLKVGGFLVQMEKNVFHIYQSPDLGDNVYQVIQNLAGDIYSGYMGATGMWNSNNNNATYAMFPEWYNVAFTRAFVGVMSPWGQIKDAYTDDPMSYDKAYAVANIVKVAAMSRITDMYGPIPYINFGDETKEGVYDSQEAIYTRFFEELKEAVDVLTTFEQTGGKVLEDYDFIFKGSPRAWIKFGNTLRLRLAMRIAYANSAKARSEAEAAVNHPIGVMTSATDVAQLQHDPKLSYNHPLYIIGYNFGAYGETHMGATMDSYMNGYTDPRLPKYFNTAEDGIYRGVRSGIANPQNYSEPRFSQLAVQPTTPMVWMQPAEAWFLRAEGAVRGWNMGAGTAQSFYEAGIAVSFDYWGAGSSATYAAGTTAPAAYTDVRTASYSQPAPSTVTVAWNEAATNEVKFEKIITQKWIAMYPDGQEAWSEFRRMGYPKVFPVAVNNSGGVINTATQIRRLPFPTTEYATNRTNVDKAVTLLGGADTGNTKLWWDKK